MLYDLDSYGIGQMVVMPGQFAPEPAPTKEVVPASWGMPPGWNYSLSHFRDFGGREITPRTIALMLADPAVSSSYNSHKMGILSGGLKLVSPVKQPAWSKRPQPDKSSPRGEETTASTDRQLSPDQTLAKEVHEFCDRAWARLKGQSGAMLWQFLDAMKDRCKLAEPVYAVPDEGIDAGKLVWDRIAVKPNWPWRFVVDGALKVTGILTYDTMGGGYVVYPPDKFIWLTWMPQDNDPRGHSVFEAARNAWNLKVQAWPQYYRHLARFGSPGLDFEMAPVDTQQYPAINTDGTPKADGTYMGAGQYYATLLGVYQSGGIFCHPNASKLQIAEPQTSGEAFLNAVSLFNSEIKLAIEYQTRVALEAKHGSKADSGTAENVKDVYQAYGREWLADGLYPAFKHLVLLNFGADAAERFTPYPTFGNAEAANRGELWSGAASIGFTIGQSQLEEMDDELGLPIRDVEADAAHAAEAMQQQADMAVHVNSSKGGDNTNGGNDSGSKPPAKAKAD